MSHIISLSQMYDFTPMIFTVQVWGFEVANSKTERDTSYKFRKRGGHAMSPLLNARVTLLC